MGLGGYLAAKTDLEHYASERKREVRETQDLPDQEVEEVAKILRKYGLNDEQMAPVVTAICSDQKRWVDFMMRFELGLEAPNPLRPRFLSCVWSAKNGRPFWWELLKRYCGSAAAAWRRARRRSTLRWLASSTSNRRPS